MNHSIYSADRTTHLKIVVVALVAGIAVAGLGISARSSSDDYMQTARVIKAGQPMAVSRTDVPAVRYESFKEFTRLFTSPPKSPCGYVEDPQLPPSRLLGKRSLPTGVFFLWEEESQLPAPRRRRGWRRR